MTTDEKLRGILSEILGAVTIADDSSLADDLHCDSLDFIELSVELENEFDIPISDDDTDRIASMRFGELVSLVQSKVENKGSVCAD